MTEAAHGINSLLLKPPGVTDLYIFTHPRYKCNISPTDKESPSWYLNLEVYNSQHKVLQVTHRSELAKHKIIKYVSVQGGSMVLAARKIESLGSIKPYFGLVSDK